MIHNNITALLTGPRTLNIAHRGARSLAPENTIAAARKALEIGADMWELDVATSYDGELVVVHDDTLERTSNAAKVFPKRRPWRVRDFTLQELRLMDFGGWFAVADPFGQVAAGAVPDSALKSYAGEPIPTLREALSFTRDHGWYVNVEVKEASPPITGPHVVDRIISLIEELNMTDRVLLSSFNHSYLERARALSPAVAIGALANRHISDPIPLLQRLGAQAYHPRVSAVRSDEIAHLRDLGFAVNVWTVNESRMMQKLIEAGASGIFTDFPQLLKPLLDI